MQDVLTKQQVQDLLGVSERTIENMVRAGVFPAPVRFGKRATWHRGAVEQWIAQRFAAQFAFTESGREARRSAQAAANGSD